MAVDSVARPPMAQLRWRCRRGMLELDVLLERFLDERYAQLSDQQVKDFATALEAEDDQLWDWLRGRQRPQEQRIAAIVEYIRQGR